MNSRENIGLITRFRKFFLNYANCKSPCTAKVWPDLQILAGLKIWISRNFERKINNFFEIQWLKFYDGTLTKTEVLDRKS